MARFVVSMIVAAGVALSQAPPDPGKPYTLTAEEQTALSGNLTELGKRVSLLRGRVDDQVLADVEVFYKAVSWAMRHPEEFYRKEYVTNAMNLLAAGKVRAVAAEAGKLFWSPGTGRVARAYRSRVDGSVQPYIMSVPPGYDGSKPMRLDLVLHGRGATLTEVSFLAPLYDGKSKLVSPGDRLELHVFGRTNNAYRWAGETDVWEAFESASRLYKVDPDRVVLRGFSMGGAGAWHIGLHHPDRFAAIEAGAGFTETLRYAKLSGLPAHQTAVLKIYDAMDYARNAVQLPLVGYGGEIDPQLQASVNVREQFAAENLTGLKALFLVGPQTPHRWHPESKKESDRFLDPIAAAGRKTPDEISFVTYTTRYPKAFWVSVEGLEKHYDRAQVDAKQLGETTVVKTTNVRRLRIDRGGALEIDGTKLRGGSTYEKSGPRWRLAEGKPEGKRPGSQGPIDDAFLESFLCVRGTGKAVVPAMEAVATARLDRFEREFAKWMRGDVRVKDDTAVTADDIARHHLVLFGDPGSNAVLRRVLPKLPLRWDGKVVALGDRQWTAAEHLPVMIYPNPLNPERYVVINTGHTFGEKEFRGTNALLFPRLGDWAVLDERESAVAAGLFDDRWRTSR